jgi:hypothetical protein
LDEAGRALFWLIGEDWIRSQMPPEFGKLLLLTELLFPLLGAELVREIPLDYRTLVDLRLYIDLPPVETVCLGSGSAPKCEAEGSNAEARCTSREAADIGLGELPCVADPWSK